MRVGRLFLLGMLALSGCGWRPVYAPGANGADSPVALELSAIEVPVMPERTGMLMRQALQDRLERFGLAVAKRYQLSAPFALTSQGVGIDIFSDVTRIRYIGSTSWVLKDASSGHIVASGHARAVDGEDLFDSQFFAATQETEQTERRLADVLAEQVVTQVSAWFVKSGQK
jgi:LPS-assembly lipoprotein